MKKVFALLLVAVMTVSCFALASCGDAETSKEESKAESSVASTDTSKDESAASTDTSTDASADESTDASADESTDASADESTDVSIDVSAGDITESTSYKYVASIDYSKGITASITVDMGIMKLINTACILGDSSYFESVTINSEGTEISKTITKDGKSYSINDETKTYVVTEGATSEDEFTVEAIFRDLIYVSTTTEELNGTTYTVDNFKTISGGQDTKLYLNEEGVIKHALMNGMIVGYDITEGVIEGCFDIPADYTEEKRPISDKVEDNIQFDNK